MRKRDLLARIETLERRVADLEVRPYYIKPTESDGPILTYCTCKDKGDSSNVWCPVHDELTTYTA